MARAVARQKVTARQRELAAEYLREHRVSSAPVPSAKLDAEINEIKCKSFKLYEKNVIVLGWAEKGRSCKVLVDGLETIYLYPFHTQVVHPFVNFSAGKEYMEEFGNCDKVEVDGSEYCVTGDVVWYINGRYLSSSERNEFGSFDKFSENKEIAKKKWIH